MVDLHNLRNNGTEIKRSKVKYSKVTEIKKDFVCDMYVRGRQR